MVGAFPRPVVVFKDLLHVEDKKGEVCCLTLSQFCFGVSCVFNQVVHGVEDDVKWLIWLVDHCLDGGGIVIKLLWVDASIVIVEELKYGRDKWCNLSGDGVAKGGEIFGVNGIDDLFDEGSFQK